MLTFSMVYLSVADEPWPSDALVDLLAVSRARNAALDVTGLLVYRDGAFMQVLEGDEAAVRQLYRKISLDPRHRDVVTIWDAYSPRRRFPDWSMGFRDLADTPIEEPGFRDLLIRPIDLHRLSRRDLVTELLDLVEPAA